MGGGAATTADTHTHAQTGNEKHHKVLFLTPTGLTRQNQWFIGSRKKLGQMYHWQSVWTSTVFTYTCSYCTDNCMLPNILMGYEVENYDTLL